MDIQKQLLQAFHLIEEFVIGLSLQGTILFINQPALSLYGWENQFVLGKSFSQLLKEGAPKGGVRSSVVEIAGMFAHWLAEKHLKRSFRIPMVLAPWVYSVDFVCSVAHSRSWGSI